MQVVIREANEADLPEMLSIYSYYVMNSNYSFEYVTPSPEVFLTRFRSITSHYPWYLATEGDRIVGYAYGSRAYERAAYSWDADVTIYLDPSAHGRGIAASLYQALISTLKLQGYYILYAGITDINHKSLAFHKKTGFREIGYLRNSGFKNGVWLGVIWMEMSLRPAEGIPSATVPYPLLPREIVRDLLSGASSSHGSSR